MNTIDLAETDTPERNDRNCVPISPGRDPFVNTPLLPLTPDADGNERFWISSYNSNVGCLAVRVTEDGDARIYPFNDKRHAGFYSAVQEDEDTLWLCGSLSRVVRFLLKTGDFQEYPTEAPDALVFQGMALDPETGKLFALAHDMPEKTVTAISFDTRKREMVQIHRGFAEEKYMRTHFINRDGSYIFVLHTPGESLLRWDPKTEHLKALRISKDRGGHSMGGGTSCRLIIDDRGRPYFPHRGWYDTKKGVFDESGPRPADEMTWFHRIGHTAWGGNSRDGNLVLGRWDLQTGSVEHLCTVPDNTLHNAAVSRNGKIVAVNKNGFFYRFDGNSGNLEMSRRLDTDSVCRVDCLCRIDSERLLGTPFITQRFWQTNIQTGKGFDCGRAAPGGGQVCLTWKINGMVYMASYTTGALVKYDPAEHPHFPENPRVVAKPPNAMRPVAAADDGRYIYYACNGHYGNLGSTLTAYDTVTGVARYKVNPLPEQAIVSLQYDSVTGSLLCGTTMEADCRSCSPTSEDCYFACIDPEHLNVIWSQKAPSGTTRAKIVGPLGKGRFLCDCVGSFDPDYSKWFTMESRKPEVPALDQVNAFPEDRIGLCYSGIPGYFIMQYKQQLELWDMQAAEMVKVLTDDVDGYAFKVQERSIYILYPRRIEILENVLESINPQGARK